MHTAVLLLFPTVNVIVTALFAGMVLRQYRQRRHPYQLYWSIGLLMALGATLAYVFMIVVQPTTSLGTFLFRLYYILGAALVPAWLGLGSIALISKARLTYICLTSLYLLSAAAAMLIFLASINVRALSHVVGTTGTGVLLPGPWLVAIITLNTLGVVAVVGVAIYSGWQLLRRQASIGGLSTKNILWANVLILGGDLLNAAAGSLARFFNFDIAFWLIMAVGWVVFFIGVVFASRRSLKKEREENKYAR
ncbi:MAG: hypothetical protein JO123_01310 [Ktedonobacteraceae bacterium]|nr:hypothetical protein [Ktedonobacteraceae bacterium]